MTSAKRIGALLPGTNPVVEPDFYSVGTNPVVEPDFYSVLPDRVNVHFERMWKGRWGGQPGIQNVEEYRVNMGSKEADEIDSVLFGFNATKMNEDVVRGVRSLPG